MVRNCFAVTRHFRAARVSGALLIESLTASVRYNSHMIKPTQKIWHNGKFIPWDDAKIHVLAHVTSYGSSVFEGIRCYATPA